LGRGPRPLDRRRQFRQGPGEVLRKGAGAGAAAGCGRDPAQGSLRSQGARDRHTPEEIAELARRDIHALAAVLGEKPYLMGDKPCGADATAFAFAAGLLCPIFDAPSRRAAEEHRNLVAYRDRLMAEFYPALAGAA